MPTVVVTKFHEFTDVIMTLPVIYSACRSNGHLDFVLLTRPSLVSLFINAPSNLKVEGVELSDERCIKGARALWRRIKEDLHPEYLVCLDTDAIFRAVVILARLGGCKASSLRQAPHHKQLIRKHNKVMLPLLSVRSRLREAFFHIGLAVQEHFQGLYGPDGKGDASLFAAVTPPPKPGECWIGIAPFAKHRGKAYPVHLMEEVLSILEREVPNIRVVLFGGGVEEREILSQWSAKHSCAMSPVQARLDFPAELSLLSYLKVLLTMDSANMHLASLVGVPVITIWGATHPYCGYKGWHQTDNDAISLPMPCRPCSLYGDRECHRGDYYCLTSIKPRFIADKVIGTISGK